MGSTLTREEVIESLKEIIPQIGRLYYYFTDADYDDWCMYADMYAGIKNLLTEMEKKSCSFLR